LRGDLFGPRIDAWFFAAALDRGEIVGDLGCGTGLVSHTLAPWVEQIIAVDASQAMLHAARKRLKDIDNVDLRKGELTELPIDAGGLTLAMMALVLPYLSDPQRGLAEAARGTRSGGRLIVMDMMPHDRVEYREELGQTWMGFSRSQMEGWMESSGWKPERWLIVPPDPEAKGPQVFVATAVRA
jgi:ArsR family transcriptional regulator